MHIPNDLLDPKVSAGTAFAAAGVLGYCFAKVKQALTSVVPESILAGASNIGCTITEGSKKIISSFAENHIMRMGSVASLIFAAQMFNFPVANGTSGHIIGGILAAIALGPFSGTLAIAAVLTVQCFFFGDGGTTALGANILNMAVVGTLLPYYIYYVIHKFFKNEAGYLSAVALSSFIAVLAASVACAFEIAASGAVALDKVLPAMAAVHARIGLGEALITIAALGFLEKIGLDLEGRVKE